MAFTRHPIASAAYLSLFGEFRLVRHDRVVRLPTRKAEALLAYLALFPKSHGREGLAGLFWGDVPDEHARGSLRKALTALRQALGDEAILADRLTVRLNPDYALWVDAVTFARDTAPTATSEVLGAALDYYRGDLLPDLYDDWVVPLRERYRALFLGRVLSLAQQLRTRSEYEAAITFVQKALAVEPANERAHQHLMFCHVALGRRSEALQQYETCKRALWDDLMVEPSPETSALYRWIKDGAVARSAEARVTNLPLPLDSFVGREEESAPLKRLLTSGDDPPTPDQPGARLVTLTGPGGSGKTRLAIQVATDLIDSFPDGVWWVELAGLGDEALVTHAVVRALGLAESPDTLPGDTLRRYLHPRQLLLVLDNCEHLVTACAVLAGALLSHAAHVKILATSRQALGLVGERALPIPTLPVPRQAIPAEPGMLLDFPGVRLFVDRARAIDPAFTLTRDNGPAVAQICARLDGIPLALELAAMWMRSLSAGELAARLDDRFELLTSGSRAASPRHQTLRGVIDWSHNLLSVTERTVFRRLAVFVGGCSLDAALAVIAGIAPAVAGPAALRALDQLVDKSLLIADRGRGETRFQLLETIRSYAHEQLQSAGEMETARAAHLCVFVAMAEQSEDELRGPRQSRRLEQLDQELDNLRAALDWSLSAGVQRGLRMAGALLWFWNLRGHWQEGPLWLSRLLTHPAAGLPTVARARALVAAANLTHWGSNDYAAARALLEEAIPILRRSPAHRAELGYALSLLGAARVDLDDLSGARLALDESLSIGEALGDQGQWIVGWALLGLAPLEDDPEERQSRLERSAAVFRTLGDRAQLPVVLAHLAWFHLGRRDYARAEACTSESLALTEAVGDVMGVAWLRRLGGDLASAQAAYDQAIAHYHVALDHFRALGSKGGIAGALDALGNVYHAQGRTVDAIQTWTQALGLYDEIELKAARESLARRLDALMNDSR